MTAPSRQVTPDRLRGRWQFVLNDVRGYFQSMGKESFPGSADSKGRNFVCMIEFTDAGELVSLDDDQICARAPWPKAANPDGSLTFDNDKGERVTVTLANDDV